MLVMGVLNVTPDSFSDGGRCGGLDASLARALALEEEGADWIDIGGESTRPGAEPVSAAEELKRVLPVVREAARRLRAPVSIDTSKPEVAEAALDAGARMVNDVRGFRDPGMVRLLARFPQAHGVVMHMQGEPGTMQRAPAYGDVVSEVRSFFEDRLAALEAAGVGRGRIWLDPGIGFGKTLEHNLELLRRVRELSFPGCRLLAGPSRKAFIGTVLDGAPVGDRLEGTLGTVAWLAAQGADMVRVHDVRPAVRVARMIEAIKGKT